MREIEIDWREGAADDLRCKQLSLTSENDWGENENNTVVFTGYYI